MHVDYNGIKNGLVAVIASSVGQTVGSRLLRNNLTPVDSGQTAIRLLAFLTVMTGSCIVKIGSDILTKRTNADDEEDPDAE